MKIKVYHISPKKNKELILKKGLVPQEKQTGRIQYSHRIFFSTNTLDLGFDFVNFENVDCWEFEIDSKLIKQDEFSGSKNHFYIDFPIPPHKIKLYESF